MFEPRARAVALAGAAISLAACASYDVVTVTEPYSSAALARAQAGWDMRFRLTDGTEVQMLSAREVTPEVVCGAQVCFRTAEIIEITSQQSRQRSAGVPVGPAVVAVAVTPVILPVAALFAAAINAEDDRVDAANRVLDQAFLAACRPAGLPAEAEARRTLGVAWALTNVEALDWACLQEAGRLGWLNPRLLAAEEVPNAAQMLADGEELAKRALAKAGAAAALCAQGITAQTLRIVPNYPQNVDRIGIFIAAATATPPPREVLVAHCATRGGVAPEAEWPQRLQDAERQLNPFNR